MLKNLLVAAVAFTAIQASALNININVPLVDAKVLATKVLDEARVSKIPFTVGDSANYAVDMGGFIKGTLDMLVREETAEGIWLEQNIDLMIQKSKVETLFDAETGQVKKMLVDGKEQKLEEGGKSEIVESKPDTITVPKGEFECTYVKIKNTDANGQSSEAELWINPELVPIVGLIKQVAQSQFGPVTIELTDFKKQ